MAKGPTVYVKKHTTRKYVRRAEVERALETMPPAVFREKVPPKGRQGFLEQDFTKGRGKDDRGLVKRNFHKFDEETIRRAAEGKD